MKKTFGILFFLLVVLGLTTFYKSEVYADSTPAPIFIVAYGDCGTNTEWSLDNEGNLTISGSGAIDDCAYNNAPWADHLSAINAIFIDDGITSIGSNTFRNCAELTCITLPKELQSIGDSAFYGCSNLSTITIPDGIQSIGDSAFYGCSNLSTITIPDGITSIGSNIFRNCAGLTYIALPEGLKSIGDSTFYGCSNLSTVTIPEGVTSIGYKAFSDCSGLKSLSIPVSTTIGVGAFIGTAIENIAITKGTGIGTVSASNYQFTPWFVSKENLKEITLDDDITVLPAYTFRCCIGLTSIKLPSGLKSIADSLFDGCEKLTEITMPEDITTIEKYAFNGCKSLTSITIPEGVTTIENSVFHGCSNLNSITIPASVTFIKSKAFYGCSNLKSITIPKSTYCSEESFGGCTNIETINLIIGVAGQNASYTSDTCQYTPWHVSPNAALIMDDIVWRLQNFLSLETIPATTSEDGGTSRTCIKCGKKIGPTIDIFPKITSIKLENDNCYYDKKPWRPSLIIQDSQDNRLVSGKDYDVTYSNNVEPGEASATVHFKGNYSGTETITFTIANIHWITIREAKQPGCMKAGNIEYWICEYCQEIYSDAAGTTVIDKDSIVIPATGHNIKEIEAKEATCGESGTKDYWACENCGQAFTDSEGRQKTTVRNQAIPATGNHTYGKWIVIDAPTVMAGGLYFRSCTICRDIQNKKVAKLKPTITLSKTTVTLKKGKSVTIKVSKLAAGDKVKSWASSRIKIAKVSKKGKITALKKGTATITVTLKSGLKRKIKVTVK